MKKKIAVVLTALMMLSCSTMFLAAGSISTDVNVTTNGPVIASPVTEELTGNKDLAIEEAAKDNAEVVAMIDLTATGAIPAEGLTITFQYAGLAVGDNVIVYHLTDAEAWEEFTATVTTAGEVTISGVTSCSPFYIAKVTPVVAPIVPPVQTPAANTTLPKTGAPVVLPFAALACVAGAVVCGRKAK